MQDTDTSERFWSKVQVGNDDECWPWLRCTFPNGYGYFWHNGRGHQAHRIAYLLTYGEIPDGLVVCHSCDNTACCNPRHLFSATQHENMLDKMSKGRCLRGEEHGRAKLTERQAREVIYRRAQGTPNNQIAAELGVSPSTTSAVTHSQNWKHLKEG